MTAPAAVLPVRATLLQRLHDAQSVDGFVSREAIERIAADLQLPLAEVWSAATSYPDFHFDGPPQGEPVCIGLSCMLQGATVGAGQRALGCQYRCYESPAPGEEAAFPVGAVRRSGPVFEESDTFDGLERAEMMGPGDTLEAVADSGLRGRGGAYFPTGRKWAAALEQMRPIALVVNAEEGEPGVFKDRAILGIRPHRFVEGLAIAQRVLHPEITVIFINGEAGPARASLEESLETHNDMLLDVPRIVPGGGGYVLGEESTLLNALEGRKPVPRLRPPFPVESGLFGMPTVVNNVETIASVAVVLRGGAAAYRIWGTDDAPGTKVLSVSGAAEHPGVYEVELGTTLSEVASMAGATNVAAALVGGPSGGFLPAAEFARRLLPGKLHETGAVTGSGGIVFLQDEDRVRTAALAMAGFNRDESCGKCTPCREGAPRVADALAAGRLEQMDLLLDVLGEASLCGLGQMAPGPVRSALHFWPELFA